MIGCIEMETILRMTNVKLIQRFRSYQEGKSAKIEGNVGVLISRGRLIVETFINFTDGG